MFKCEGCGKEFETRKALASHRNWCKEFIGEEKYNDKCKRISEIWTPENREKLRKANVGKILSEEHRRKISEANKKIGNHKLGTKLSEETKKKISKSNLGKKRTEEFKKKLSIAHTGKTLPREQVTKIQKANTGKKRSEESRKRISEAAKNSFLNGRQVVNPGKRKTFYSYYKNYMFRSSCEAIYAIWLIINNIPFEYESIRVEYNNKIHISDFYHDGIIYEIKPRQHKDYEIVREAFESNGYKFKFIYNSDTNNLYYKMLDLINIEEFWKKLEITARAKYKGERNDFLRWDIVDNQIVFP